MSMNNNKSFVNSNKDAYKKYIAQLFANSIATIEPKIVIKNNELQEEWNKLTKNINLIQINYLLVNEISQNGNAVLFLTNYFEKLKIFVSRIWIFIIIPCIIAIHIVIKIWNYFIIFF